jgi:two-component system response regulator HydG
MGQLVRDGRFREDVYYRINVIPVHTPPLRDHPEDIPLLVSAFAARFARKSGEPLRQFSPLSLQRLMRHPWPGNVRELENTVERALTLDSAEVIGAESLLLDPVSTPDSPPIGIGAGFSLPRALGQAERNFVEKALEMTAGKRPEAARLLGITERALKYLIKKGADKEL